MNYTEKLNKEIDRIVADAEASKSNITKRMQKAEAEKAEAQAALDAAAEANDDVKYHAAKEKLRFATDTIEMCSNRLKSLEGPLCSSDKNADVVSQIDEEVEKAARAAEKAAASLLAELYKVTQEFDSIIADSNAVMKKWTNDVMRSSVIPTTYNIDISEVHFIGKTIRQRMAAKQSLAELGRASMSIYDSIK